MKKILFVLVMIVLMLAATVSVFADGTVAISTADELIAVLTTTSSNSYDTLGKTYVLQNDITIDTSRLETSYGRLNSSGHERVFQGVLDGGGHTVTVVSADGKAARPLFDSLRGSSTQQHAEVKNLKLVFKDDVAGTTIAAHTSYAKITDVDISFEKDIIFAVSPDDHAIATGVYGFTSDGIDIRVTNVSVTATGSAPYGIIGSMDPQNHRYVMAAGVYSEHTAAGGDIVCDGITVDVRGIYAVSGYMSSNYSACCAAGAVSGFDQSNTNLGNVKIVVDQDISARAYDGAYTDVDAYGLAYKTNSIYNCVIEIFGSIESTSNGGSISWSSGPSYEHFNSSALGIGYIVSTDHNKLFYNADSIGEVSVSIHGSIVAKSQGNGSYPWFTLASGCAYNVSYNVPWENVTIKVRGDILSENACTDGFYGYSNMAYSSGFAMSEEIDTYTNNYDLQNCNIDANSISATATEATAIACGAILQNYGTCKDCTITAKQISATGASASAAGFSYTLNPDRSTTENSRITVDNCTVDLDELIATGDSSEVAGLICGLLSNYSSKQETVQNCSVEIGKTISAETVGLLVTSNIGEYSLYDNTVTLPWSQADVQTIGETDYVLFTASEVAGQADKTGWQSGNRVIFAGDSVNSVTCAFDDGNAIYGTRWKLERTANLFTVKYDLDGGTGAPGADYSPVTVNEGDKVTLPAAPEREDYIFIGWSDGTDLYQPDGEAEITANVTFTAQWEADVKYFTLTYNSNGGTEFEDEVHPEGKEVSLDKVPERDSYTFLGWFSDETLTQKIEKITMDDHKTVHAGWEKDEEPWIPPIIPPVEPSEPEYVPNWLNTEDHFGYIIGYEDGTIRPRASITRAEVATIFFRLLTDEARAEFWTETNDYTDVSSADWFNNAVSTLSRMGILGGYEDGTFRPNATITRAEFAKIAVSFFEYEDIEAKNIFTDVAEGSWYESFVAAAAEIGLIEGYEGSVFRPDESITRAEACTIINRTLNRAPDKEHLLPESEMNVWPDNTPDEWFYADMQEATNSHEYKWLGDIEQWLEKLPERDWDALQ